MALQEELKMRTTFIATALASVVMLSTAPAMADETWITDMGIVAWDDTLGETAVLVLNANNGLTLRAYVPGLGRDMMGGRGTYHGYWLSTGGDERCDVMMTAPDGEKSNYWGTFTMSFVREDFPSDWAGTSGSCFYPQESTISGQVPN